MNDYLSAFLEYLTVEMGLSENTRAAYRTDLEILSKDFGFEDTSRLSELNRQDLGSYLTRLKRAGPLLVNWLRLKPSIVLWWTRAI